MADKSMRIKVKEMIETGKYTKAEIAEELNTKVPSISSNLTYLRWGGFFIIWDANKKLSFTDEAGFDEWEAARKAKSGGSKAISKLTPQEQFDKYTKTIANQNKQLEKWEQKVSAGPQDDETILPEAEANVVLLEIKIQRNQAKLDAIDLSEVEDSKKDFEKDSEEDSEEELL